MRSIVVDFEFCQVNRKQRERGDSKLYNEIIEFGAVMLDQNMNITGRFQRFVRPEFGKVDMKIKKLTGISNEMLENEEGFQAVLDTFVHWIGSGEVEICSWSMADQRQLCAEMEEKTEGQYESVFWNWRDIQREFGDGIGYKGMLSLKNAMSSIDEDFTGKAHDALADAENTAGLVSLLADRKLFDKRTRPLQDLLKPVEEVTLGSMFADLFAQFA